MVSSLYVLFMLSSLVRFLVTLRLLPLIREVRPVDEASAWNLMMQVVGLSGVRGLSLWPVVVGHDGSGAHDDPDLDHARGSADLRSSLGAHGGSPPG
jgi:hypothetical protein